jgi:hypothetical protein
MEVLKIERFKFVYLRHMEFTIVVPRIVAIVESHDPDALRLTGRLNAVKAFLPDLDRIEVQERKWRESALLAESERVRDDMVNTIIRVERAYARVTVPGCEEASEKLTALFDKHKRDIAADGDTAETQRIYNLTEDIERTPGLPEALNGLALTPAYNAMKEANIRFDELWRKRNKELSEKDKVDSKAIRVACVQAVNHLYDGIDFYVVEYGVEAYRPLIMEINKLNAYYRQHIEAGLTLRKKNSNKPVQPEN